ncbi:MAG: hypothetical protein A2W31_05055 [Planctomycetes bacterium RBG_16_64_10]|nr:MAG: hypothetical protein A2W31_05055 [Planctomycetes bacterium RBG_16_64_10]
MKTVQLTKGKVALVDDRDYPLVSRYRWKAIRPRTIWYAQRNAWNGRRYVGLFMHRVVMAVGDGERVDHVNCDGLDNRRSNLRVATRSENAANFRKSDGCSSRFKGVSRHRKSGRWRASIQIRRRVVHLGYFDREEDAARAYDAAAVAVFGEFARTNFGERRASEAVA